MFQMEFKKNKALSLTVYFSYFMQFILLNVLIKNKNYNAQVYKHKYNFLTRIF